ncbi:haloacid dehalogenase type II [Candidatus Daviesbacteria bacterium]|nr:haloacid dehalogenase type II [Candidatus Daviesbacteria bacterium]
MIGTTNIKAISFDCYGTLIDWDSGTYDFFRKILPLEDKERILNIIKRWEAIQFQLIQKQYMPYNKIQEISLIKTLHKFNLFPGNNLGKKFLEQVPKWKPFTDVYPILSKLKNSYKLILVSNGPLSILKKNTKKMGIKFDKIISAESIRAYKPNTDVFRYLLRQLNYPLSEILHVATGYKYDVIPAKALGIKTIWVNRKQILYPGTVSPDYEIINLTKLPMVMSYL